MADITEFLLARIDDDEHAVAAVLRQRPHWAVAADWPDAAGAVAVTDDPQHETAVAFVCGDYAAKHIAHWHPARVLAECEAKRRIVERHRMIATRFEVLDATMTACEVCSTIEEDGPCIDLRLLAQPYADHPDFDPAWKPA